MKIVLFISILIIGSAFSAQQLSFNSQYMLNQYMINTAAAGQHTEAPISLSVRQQWAGMQGAPVTQFISFNRRLGKKQKMAFGTQFFNDVNGAFKNMGMQGTYAYHLKINENSKLSFGASAILSQTTVDGTNFIVNDYSDETLLGVKQKSFAPDASAGIFYFSQNVYFGVSANQLLEAKYSFGENLTQNRQVNHIYASGGVIIKMAPGYRLEPSFLLKTVGPAPTEIYLNARFLYRENVWLGFSYRNSGATALMVGLERDRFVIGYAHDFTSSNIKNYSAGTNELYLQYSFKNKHKGATKF
ncbi:MAG: type IX secretion system membrane protein PorP/SprF [Flavobacteriales bacterium]|nr:type IX secretion system membrane protein PorP/SprF [Flavobacteriales bacterium]